MRRLAHLAAFTVAMALVACGATPSPSDAPTCPTSAPSAEGATAILADARRAVVATNLGSFTIQLQPDGAPIATANFVALARCGFYAQISFHRVLAGFVAQAGDPQTRSNHGDFSGVGAGGPGYEFEVEFPTVGEAYEQYTVAMANSMQYDPVTGEITGGTDTNGSQFFIDLESLAGRLRPYYTIIGKVVEGTEVVDAIGAVAVNDPSRGVPLEPVIIESVTVENGG
ncbi:MAG: peptidylprolyl isomerase [Chloroflexota bacterium]|nr:peptidylprolyl isomerase [Chloroflexota bacterium]